jgi:hypothetical protein
MRKVLSILFLFTLVSGAALAHCGHCGVGDKPAGATTGEKKCDHAEKSAKCGEACPAHGKEIAKTTENTAVSGTIKCMHCDLHKADKCQKVLVTADSKIYEFCPGTTKDVKLEKMSGKEVTAKGTVHEIKDGNGVIHLTSLEAKS